MKLDRAHVRELLRRRTSSACRKPGSRLAATETIVCDVCDKTTGEDLPEERFIGLIGDTDGSKTVRSMHIC